MPSEVGRPIYLDQVARDFPDLVIIGRHIDYPWTDEAIAVATKHQKVYIDTSAHTPSQYPAALTQYLKSSGRKKVLFGTNFPMLMHTRATEGLDTLELEADVLADFLAGNAERVFQL